MNQNNNEIYDLYVTNISRFSSDHYEVSKELEEYFNHLIDKNIQEAVLGRVILCKIPYLKCEDWYS